MSHRLKRRATEVHETRHAAVTIVVNVSRSEDSQRVVRQLGNYSARPLSSSVTSVGATRAYRPDIDGLRAIAVAAVVAFHAFPNAAPSGFIGVDVFFVISGFLITGLIADGIADGTFSIGDFYGRRVRRIFPSLLLVISVYLIGGWFAMPPGQYAHLGKHSLFGSLFTANLSLWSEGGYFDGPVELKPLLHLWSLGIEEQFYLIWPVALWLLWRSRGRLLSVAAVALIVSFALNVYEVDRHPTATFYLPVTRFWELLIGAGLALGERAPGGTHWPHWFRPNIRATTGLALLIAGGVWITGQAVFPGWWAALPTLGAMLLISAGASAGINRVWLSHPVMVFIGLISYPLYLWHWPLLHASLLPIAAFQTPTAAVVISVILAWLTYRFWERPLRLQVDPRIAVRGLVAASLIVAAVGSVVWAKGGVPERLTPEMRAMVTPSPLESAWRFRKCFLDVDTQVPADLAPECIETTAASAPLLAIWGDSHGAELYSGIHALQARQGFRVAQLTATMCPPLINKASSSVRCDAMRTDLSRRLVAAHPDVVVLTSAWWRDAEDLEQKLRETIAFIRESGTTHISLIGPPPHWAPTMPVVLFQATRELGHIPDRLLGDVALMSVSASLDARLRVLATAERVDYISPLETFCDPAGCMTRITPDLPGGLISFDREHLSPAAVTYLVERTFAPLVAHLR